MTEEECEEWTEWVLSLAHRAYDPAQERAFLDRMDGLDLADLRMLLFVCARLESSAYRSLLPVLFERRRVGVDTWPIHGHIADYTLLSYMIAFRLFASATELLSLGADPNGEVQRGRTPLYYALIQYDTATTADEHAAAMEMIQRLIRAGADPAAVARDGRMFGIRIRYPDLTAIHTSPRSLTQTVAPPTTQETPRATADPLPPHNPESPSAHPPRDASCTGGHRPPETRFQ